MKTLWKFLSFSPGVLLASGCATHSVLDQQTQSPHAKFGDQPISVASAPLNLTFADAESAAFNGPSVFEDIQGTWTFTTPPTVTRVEHKNSEIDQFTLYLGRPRGADTPFLVITVGRNRQSSAQADPEMYKISGRREYPMNGNLVQEWTGLTRTGAGFSELVIRKPGPLGQTGDICHALAIARTQEEQKLAVSILGSINYKPLNE